MADKKITNLSEETSPASVDVAHIITDIATGATNKKITLANFFNKVPTWLGLAATPATVTSGVIDITTPITFVSVTGTQAYSLAAGAAGQIKILVCTVAASTPVGVVTPAASATDGYNTITFNAVGETATLIYTNSGWMILSLGGTSTAIAAGTGPVTA